MIETSLRFSPRAREKARPKKEHCVVQGKEEGEINEQGPLAVAVHRRGAAPLLCV